jgi:Tol biopolymer transport system component
MRISVDSAGTEGNGGSGGPAISADGRYVVFSSSAANIVAGDTNNSCDTNYDGVYMDNCPDVFVRDRQTGVTERVSVSSAGSLGNGHSQAPSISSDGRYVAFDSYASNLMPDDTRDRDIFVHDRQTGVTEQVSVDSAGNQANNDSYYPAISGDGRYVAFGSIASNLVLDDTNDVQDVFVHDRGEAPAPTPTPTQGHLTVCPEAGKWAISVWDGPSGTATGDALTTCADVSIGAVYWLDPATQRWWRYFPGLDISDLLTLDAHQPIIVRGR